MWFYSGSGYLASGMISSISCMGNPAVWWFGLFAILFIAVRACWQRRSGRLDLFLLIGFASQYLPWVLVPRSTFIYHYFASVPFIIGASAALLEDRRAWWAAKPESARKTANAVTAALCAVLAAMTAVTAIPGVQAEAYVSFMCAAAFFSVLAGRGLSMALKGKLSFAQCTLLAAALILFIAFYPLESGLPVSRHYARLLRWFKWYNF
jgi:dolichyl-phosphate-mannose--protein O-mannosyl transferase